MAQVQPDFTRIGQIAPAFSKWCCWKYVQLKGGKPSKIPYRNRGRGKELKSNEPETWLDYEAAYALYERGGFDGVGALMAGAKGIIALTLTTVWTMPAMCSPVQQKWLIPLHSGGATWSNPPAVRG